MEGFFDTLSPLDPRNLHSPPPMCQFGDLTEDTAVIPGFDSIKSSSVMPSSSIKHSRATSIDESSSESDSDQAMEQEKKCEESRSSDGPEIVDLTNSRGDQPTKTHDVKMKPPKKKKKKDEVLYTDVVISGKIGEGSFGEVFKGVLWGQDIALKKLRIKSNDSALKNFKQEVKIMRALRHPNIVEFLGVVTEPEKGNLCIITEYLPKGSLEEILTRKMNKGVKYKFQTILSLALDIARGLTWLHNKGIIHRDLKTANILVDKHGRAKICDFGLSHVKKRKALHGLYGVCGTPCYMAPEVLNKTAYGVQADIFSYGIVLCEVLAGEYPYKGEPESTATFEDAIVAGLRPEIPPVAHPALADLIERCWQEKPDMRPTGEQLVRDLLRIGEEYKMSRMQNTSSQVELDDDELPEDVRLFLDKERLKLGDLQKKIHEHQSIMDTKRQEVETLLEKQKRELGAKDFEIAQSKLKAQKLEDELAKYKSKYKVLQKEKKKNQLMVESFSSTINQPRTKRLNAGKRKKDLMERSSPEFAPRKRKKKITNSDERHNSGESSDSSKRSNGRGRHGHGHGHGRGRGHGHGHGHGRSNSGETPRSKGKGGHGRSGGHGHTGRGGRGGRGRGRGGTGRGGHGHGKSSKPKNSSLTPPSNARTWSGNSKYIGEHELTKEEREQRKQQKDIQREQRRVKRSALTESGSSPSLGPATLYKKPAQSPSSSSSPRSSGRQTRKKKKAKPILHSKSRQTDELIALNPGAV